MTVQARIHNTRKWLLKSQADLRVAEEIFATVVQDLQNHGFPIQGKQGSQPSSQVTDTRG